MKGNEIREIDGVLVIALKNNKNEIRAYALASLEDRALIEEMTWCVSAQGYVVGKHPGTGRVIKMNRFLIFGAAYNELLVDHRDGDKMNNQRANLRQCDHAGNARNTRRSKNNTSGAKGVSKSFNGTRWRARIWKDWKEVHLGVFDTAEQAALAYDRAAAEMHGEFASPNFATPAVVVAIRAVAGEAA